MKSVIQAIRSNRLTRILLIITVGVFLIAIAGRVTTTASIWYYQKNPELLMEGIPFYAVIQKYDPALYTQLRSEVSEALTSQESIPSLSFKIGQQINDLIDAQMPKASDQAMMQYMQANIAEMQLLKQQGYGLCHQFLYPKPQTQVDLSQFITDKVAEQNMNALTEVITSAYTHPLPKPNERSVQNALNKVYAKMQNLYGPQYAILQNPFSSDVDKDTVCTMSISFFQELLKLPAHESGASIRYYMMQDRDFRLMTPQSIEIKN